MTPNPPHEVLEQRIRQLERESTERRRAEEELQKQRETFYKILQNDPHGIALVDRDGRYLYVNPQFTEISGYDLHDVPTGREWFRKAYPDPEYRKVVIGTWKRESMREGRGVDVEFKITCKDGSVKDIEFRSTYLKDYSISVLTDVTPRKRAEEEKEKLQSHLVQAQKMELVGRLAGGVAHDFNNMLGIIIGNTEMALSNTDPGAPICRHLREILKASQRSADLVRQLLAFARKQMVSPQVLDLNKTVEGMVTMLERLIGEDIDLAWRPGPDLWSVKIDPTQIDQVLANLAVNARDAIAGVGKVTIETNNVTFDESYVAKHPGFHPGHFVLLAVSDNGKGMSEEVLGHLFEPFFTTKETGKGTGLGLAMVYGVVKQNEGFINVYTEPGKGTTFKVYLPRFDEEHPEAKVKTGQEALQRGTETVLLVEDEAAILRIGKAMLESLGYNVLSAGTPTEAVRIAEEHSSAIHLLFTDVVMPGMNGRELSERLRLIHPGLKCLYMSGYTSNVIAHHGILEDGVFFIQKPFLLKDLAAKVRQALMCHK